ncbi:complement factor H [Stegastes partitus]|uniref:Complement factor H-like n=1 Tax=Stegastes partitus TaxID=144197 RepID=A0A3B4ZU87_9TELE|nr:PREDICTED: complement factor H-like [Stegastes partitus]
MVHGNADKMHILTKTYVLFLWMHLLTFVKSQDCTLEQFLNSRAYDSNFDIIGLEASYAGGKQVRVGCNVGYTGFFKLICVEGKWQTRGNKCQPKSCGHPGDAQFADFNLAEGDDFVFGSKVVYTCHKGYQMVSRTNFRRCMAEGWDGVVPVCEAQQCPVINVASNVQIIGDPEEANYGNVVRFRCKSSSEVLEGSAEMYCDENGEWKGKAPICTEIKCTVPVIENGFVPGDLREYKENTVLNFQCDPQYKPAEERLSKCIKVGPKADWSPTPACEPIRCELKLPALTGTRYEPASRSVFSPGDTIRVVCGEEHWIVNEQTTSVESTCQSDGIWSIRPICQEVICSNQRDPLVYSWDVYRNEKKKLGDKVYYTCRWGYEATNSDHRATCTRDGWTPKPLCRGTRCDKPDIANADITYNNKWEYRNSEQVQYTCRIGNQNTFTITCNGGVWTGIKSCSECPKAAVPNGFVVGPHKDKLYYTCNEGFKLSTKGWWGEAKCVGGVWSGLEQCIDKRLCGEPPVIPNGKALGRFQQAQSLQIICNEGYLAENEELTCHNGKWHPTALSLKTICRPIADHCSPPTKVENAVVLTSYQKEYVSDSEVTYKCRDKFIMEGEDTIRCKNGQWEDKDIKCIPYCDKLSNEKLSMNFTSDKDRYMNGDVIEYECVIPDAAAEGTATCTDGKWIKTVECKVKPCPLPDATPNGIYKIIEGEDFVFGTTIQYVCKKGYHLVGKDTLTCSLDGWTDRTPTCQQITCEIDVMHPGLTAIGLPSGRETLEVGHTLRFHCSNEYQLDGSKEIECLETGQWSAPFPTCSEKCKVPRLPDNISFTPGASSRLLLKGQKLTFRCRRPGHFIQGNATVECLASGQWSASIPTCGNPVGCGKPPHLENGDTKETIRFQHRHNEKVEYVCQNVYTMEGGPFMTCTNGNWTGQIRCLKPCTVDEDAMSRHNIRFRHTWEKKLYSPHDDAITFSCSDGTRHDGTLEMRQKCINGVIHLPTCQ